MLQLDTDLSPIHHPLRQHLSVIRVHSDTNTTL